MKSKLVIILTIISLLFTGSTTTKKLNYEPQYIKTSSYEGVILTEKGTETWTPDKKMISNFESGLKEYLNSIYLKSSQNPKNKNNSMQYMYGDTLFVIKNIKDYKRQYWGTFDNGTKVIYSNFLLITQDNTFYGNWKIQKRVWYLS